MTSFLRTRKDRHPRAEAKPRTAEDIKRSTPEIDRFKVPDDAQQTRQDHLSRTIDLQQSQKTQDDDYTPPKN